MDRNWFRLGLIMRVISLEDRKNGFEKAKNNFNTWYIYIIKSRLKSMWKSSVKSSSNSPLFMKYLIYNHIVHTLSFFKEMKNLKFWRILRFWREKATKDYYYCQESYVDLNWESIFLLNIKENLYLELWKRLLCDICRVIPLGTGPTMKGKFLRNHYTVCHIIMRYVRQFNCFSSCVVILLKHF